MPLSGNSIDTNVLASLSGRAGPQVTSAIRQASLKTGVDFAYLMEKAAAESNFDTDAKARSSSASGLYQFIESTWLQMVNRYGDKHGLGDYADKINDQGKVTDLESRKEILALRNDPEIASLMAGEFAAENRQTLINSGIKARDIGSTELYLAHFLGAGAASEFIKGMQENPLTPAADLFPRAAKANKNVFYNSKTHAAKSLGEIYAFFDKKFGDGQPVPPQNPGAGNKTIASANIQPALQAAPTPSLVSIDYDYDTQDIIALMGSARPVPAQQDLCATPSTRLPGTLISDPVALMLMARRGDDNADNRRL
jgi:hypothetical protein